MTPSKSSRLRLQLQKIVFTVLLLLVVGLLSWLSLQNPVQYDWSANNRNSVSQKTIDILDNMPDDIMVNVYVQDNETKRMAITELLQRYQREKDNFRFKLINPDIDITLASEDDIKQYGQIVIRYRDKKEIITSLSESVFSSALLRLSQSDERSAVFITGHGERNPAENNNHGYSQLTTQLQTNGFKVRQIHLLQNQIPADTSVLVVAGVSNEMLAGEIEKIEQYLDTGGNLLWLVDPGTLHGLEPVAEKLDVDFYKGLIVDNNIDVRKTLQIEHPAIIPVLEYFPHKITEGLQYNTLFPTSRGIDISSVPADSKWHLTPLFSSFAQSWSEANGIANKIVFDSNSGDIAGPITLGVSLQRKLDGNNSTKSSQRIVIIGDSDFLANSYIGAGANLSLGLNTFSWLAGDDNLVTIIPKGAPDTKLRLNDIEVALIGMSFFIIIPLFLMIMGVSIWLKRRNS